MLRIRKFEKMLALKKEELAGKLHPMLDLGG